jgi:hypothetical protein
VSTKKLAPIQHLETTSQNKHPLSNPSLAVKNFVLLHLFIPEANPSQKPTNPRRSKKNQELKILARLLL